MFDDEGGDKQHTWANEHGSPDDWMLNIWEDYMWMTRGFLPLGPSVAAHDWQWREAVNTVDAEWGKCLEEKREAAAEGRDARGNTGAGRIRSNIGVAIPQPDAQGIGGVTAHRTSRRPSWARSRSEE